MIDATKHPKPAQALFAAARTEANPIGTRIVYFEGDYSSNVNRTEVGKEAVRLFEAGRVHLFQKVIQTEPRRYQYIAVTR